MDSKRSSPAASARAESRRNYAKAKLIIARRTKKSDESNDEVTLGKARPNPPNSVNVCNDMKVISSVKSAEYHPNYRKAEWRHFV